MDQLVVAGNPQQSNTTTFVYNNEADNYPSSPNAHQLTTITDPVPPELRATAEKMCFPLTVRRCEVCIPLRAIHEC